MDGLRLTAWLIILTLIFAPLENWWCIRKQQFFRKDFLADIGYFLINSIAPKMLLILPTVWLALVMNAIVPTEIHKLGAELPVMGRFVATLVVAEFGIYWGHRWMHEIPLLWRFHAIHHSAEEMDWLVNTRAHPVDMTIPRLCGFVPMYAFGLVQPLGESVDIVLIGVLFVSVLWGFFIHANLRWRFGWLEWLISTPAFHHWHHTNDGPEFVNKNYSAMIPWVDMLFGTFYLPKHRPQRFGITESLPSGLIGQLLFPFEPRKH